MVKQSVQADVTSISQGGTLDVQPPHDEGWILKCAFADKPEKIKFKITNQNSNECVAELVAGDTASIPVDHNNCVLLENDHGHDQTVSYHAVQIG